MKHIKKSLPVERISPADGHYFFGYYDLQPYNFDETLYLTHKTDFRNRLHTKDDYAQIGYIDLKTGEFKSLDKTYAWNFQQGSMLQWNLLSPNNEIIYNAVINGKHKGVILDVKSGEKRFLSRAVANVSRDGKYALSINMSRLYDFRPGYGYAFPKDPFYNENHSENDGVFLIDMESGKSKLILSMQKIWEFSGSFFDEDEKMIINHITFNTDASRFLMLVRNFPKEGKKA